MAGLAWGITSKRFLRYFALLPGLVFAPIYAQLKNADARASSSGMDVNNSPAATTAAGIAGQIKADPKAAVDEVEGLFTPNPDVRVAGTRAALVTTGSWAVKLVRNSDSDVAPQACDGKTSPCVRVFYRVQSPGGGVFVGRAIREG